MKPMTYQTLCHFAQRKSRKMHCSLHKLLLVKREGKFTKILEAISQILCSGGTFLSDVRDA